MNKSKKNDPDLENQIEDKVIKSKKHPLKKANSHQLFERLKNIIGKLEGLVTRVRQKTELSIFLTEVGNQFELEMMDDWDKVDLITIEDTLAALE